ncbi:phosphoglycerol transferase [Modicisalibacter muralis]|uniref:Phosphoglycerol transferase n=1 Tax=Modicisalibacter muralis TaxID=119000 RepID=A0A1G9GTN3_9GAMM|nr:sulfatase-like hydrolase/transferase [Halomonas muralis]SDL04027.1 phosphoglycerol transferase [Halomonas muralis]
MGAMPNKPRRGFPWSLAFSYIAVFMAGAVFYRLRLWPFGEGYYAALKAFELEALLSFLDSYHVLEGFVVVCLFYLMARTRSRLAIVLGVLGFVYIFLWGLWVVSDMMTGVGINQAVIFHLFSGTEGADYSQFLGEIAVAVIFLLLAVSVVVFSLGVGWRSRRTPKRRTRMLPLGMGFVMLVAAWLVSPWHQDIMVLADSYSRINSDQARRLDAMYVVEPRVIENKQNLVVLYLEGVERTYFNDKLFPGLLPNLSRLRETSLSFSGIEQSPGAGWTIAGMVNTQCGIPLVTPGAGINDMGHVERFLPEAKCIAEILAENDYQTVYIGGASGKFAGKGSFLRQHGFMEVKDRAYFQTEQPLPESAFSGWGLYDDTLLQIVYDEFVALSEEDGPFALFALTMDTHPPNHHVPPSCEGVHYGDGSSKALNSLRCTDRLVSEFIDRIRRSPYYENTTLVVLSDHLSMVNDAKVALDKAPQRENLLMIFDASMPSGERHVQGTMVDIGATLLDVLDASETRLGFGRSLLGSNGQEASYSSAFFAEQSLAGYLSFSRQLWDMPSVVGRIYSDGNGGVILGESLVDAPFFSVLNSQNKVVEIYFDDFAEKLDELQRGARYLYALSCESTRSAESGVCLVSGLKGVSEKIFSSVELGNGIRAAELL